MSELQTRHTEGVRCWYRVERVATLRTLSKVSTRIVQPEDRRSWKHGMAGTRGWRLIYLWLKGYFDKNNTFLELEPWEETVTQILCDKCGGREFIEGPSGGLSTNFICANPKCRARYNVHPGGKEFV